MEGERMLNFHLAAVLWSLHNYRVELLFIVSAFELEFTFSCEGHCLFVFSSVFFSFFFFFYW